MKNNSFLRASLGALLLGLGLLGAGSAQAGSYTWVGGNTGYWNTAGNWVSSGGPGFPTDASFDGAYIFSGTANVSSGSNGAGGIWVGGTTTVGSAGLIVSNEALLHTEYGFYLGANPLVANPNYSSYATFRDNAVVNVAGAYIGSDSYGSLTVKDDATFNVSYQGLSIGSGSYSQGVLNIQDNASVNVGSAGITVIGGTHANAQGTLNLLGGTLETGAITKGAGNATLNLNGGTIKATSDTVQSKPFFVNFTGPLTLGANGLTLDSNSHVLTSTNTFTGAGGLTKTGLGTVQLTLGSHNYTGATNVLQGTLSLDNAAIFSSTSVNIAKGATINVSSNGALYNSAGSTLTNNGNLVLGTGMSVRGLVQGTGNFSNAYDVYASGTFAIGMLGSIGTTSISGGAIFLQGGTLVFDLAASGVSDKMYNGVAFSLSGGGKIELDFLDGFYTEGAHSYDLMQGAYVNSASFTDDFLNLVDWSNLAEGWEVDNVSFDFSSDSSLKYTLTFDLIQTDPVPEPGTWALLAGGVGMLVLGQRLRRKGAR